MRSRRFIIAGGRDYVMTDDDRAWLDRLHAHPGWPITEVLCGGATGADAGGKAWAESRGIPVRMFPADWQTHGRAAGPLRNQQMAENADALVAFPGGRGTADMIRRARNAELSISIAHPSNHRRDSFV